MSRWTTPEDLRRQLHKLWDRGRLLTDTTLFPLRLPLRAPAAGDLGDRYDEVRAWVQNWAQQEGQQDFALEWRETNSRDIGRNRLPAAVLFDDRDRLLTFIGKRREGRTFDRLRAKIVEDFPALGDWVEQRPLQVLVLEAQWPRLLVVVDWLCKHPQPGVYIRQLELPGVDTKFVEAHRKVLIELLDRVLEPEQINDHARGIAGFEARYGFRAKPAQIRFRLLDPRLYLLGLEDLQIPAADFARLALPVERVFITENDINGLAFPDTPRALVIFGLGYGLDSLRDARWLTDMPIHYWGDIDTHGFAMLDQLRSYFPQARSLLMDRATLLAHQPLWGREARPTRKVLPHLDDEEGALYQDLCIDRIAPSLRLEQERIGYDHVRAALRSL
jgi:hypothetical protein